MKSKPEAGGEPGLADLRQRALRLLARREHSRAELARKLEHAGYDSEDIAPLLDEFEGKNWLSDRRFAESYVADHRARSGNIRLAYELRQRGVSETVITKALNDDRGSELERARGVWRKKFSTAPCDAVEKTRQIRFMQGRGFALTVIREILSEASEPEAKALSAGSGPAS